MGKITLPARVVQTEEGCTASIDNLELVGEGITVDEAQADLVEKFSSWAQACEGQETLEQVLEAAGYLGVDEETELELVFVE